MSATAAVAIHVHMHAIVKSISKFLEANCIEDNLENVSLLEGIELQEEAVNSTDKSELISRSIKLQPIAVSEFKSNHGLTLMETFVVLFYEATPGRDFNFFQGIFTNTYVYMIAIADLLISGKISLCYLQKKSLSDWFSTDCHLQILDASPCGNYLDTSYFGLLKDCVNSYKSKMAKVGRCMDYANRSFLFQDKRKFSGFLDCVDSLIAKGFFKRNESTGVFHWMGLGSYYYQIEETGRTLQLRLRDELRGVLLNSQPMSEFNRLLLGLLVMGGDGHGFFQRENKYLKGVLTSDEMKQEKPRLQKFMESNGKWM